MPTFEHFSLNSSDSFYHSKQAFISYKSADIFNDPGIEEQYPPDLELEPVHLDIDLHLDLASETASGRVTTTVKARRSEPTTLTLDAVDLEEVEVCDPDGNDLTWRYDGSKLAIHWMEPFTVAEQRRVEVSYRVVEPAAGLYFSKPNNATYYFQEADEKYKRPIVTRRFKSSWDMFDRHLYEGGAYRLHTLRCELGDAVFWPAVQDYLERYNGQVVETDHFRHVMEEHSGRSLGKFFDQWFYTADYPALKVSFSFDAKRRQGTFEIEQAQVDEEKSIPAFVLSTDLSWTIDGAEHQLPIKLDQAKQVITVLMDAEPEQVRFDPGCKVLHKLDFNPRAPRIRQGAGQRQQRGSGSRFG